MIGYRPENKVTNAIRLSSRSRRANNPLWSRVDRFQQQKRHKQSHLSGGLFFTMALITAFLIIAAPSAWSAATDDDIEKVQRTIVEFNRINSTLDRQYQAEKKSIEKEYYLQMNLIYSKLPPAPESKGMFETTSEYKKRIRDYERTVDKEKRAQRMRVKQLQKEFNLRFETAKAEIRYLKKKISLLDPLVKELEASQKKMLQDDDTRISMTIYEPDADNYRFPMRLTMANKSWSIYWNYTKRNEARQLWRYRSSFIAVPLFQLQQDKNGTLMKKLTALSVTFSRTGESRTFTISEPEEYAELSHFRDIKFETLPAAELLVALNDVVKGPISSMEFIYISPRTFDMGSPRNEEGRWANETLHSVKLTRGFYMQTTEVTQEQWRLVMGENPSEFLNCGSSCPVENIYWGDAQEFISRLNRMSKNQEFRLPTEAEWEFSARAGSAQSWTCGDNPACMDDYGWYSKNSEGTPHPVATKKPNYWGLYDMHGNVAEWCSDWFGNYPATKIIDPLGPFKGKFRVARGGSWFHPTRNCRSADRNVNIPGDRSSYLGLRLVMDVPK